MATEAEPLFIASLSNVKGNVPDEDKRQLARWYAGAVERQGFARDIAKRLEATEMSVYDKAEEPGKKEARLVFELDVQEGKSHVSGRSVVTKHAPDMCNFGNNMHGGCTAFLIDL